MKTNIPLLLVSVCSAVLLFNTVPLLAQQASVGKPAPDFSLTGGDGKTHSLTEYKGKIVVLEWTNPGCPFVKRWYNTGSMQKLQKEATAQGVVWLRINSGAPGKQGQQSVAEIAAYDRETNVGATASLLDPEGKVGRAYGARTTPDMFVIDSAGTLVYAGGIDNKPSVDPAVLPAAKNYVTDALDEVRAGKPVSVPTAPSYGCSVKYADK